MFSHVMLACVDVGAGLAPGVFPNPHTMRPQIDIVLNHILHSEACARTNAEMNAWLASLSYARGEEGEEIEGAAAHVSEHLAELQYQRKALTGRTRTHSPTLPSAHVPGGSAEESVLSAGRRAGLSLTSWAACSSLPLVTLGMDSLGAVRFRTLLSRHFPDRAIPNIASLLWDLPTLSHVVEFLRAPAPPPVITCAPRMPIESSFADIEPLLTRLEAEAYVREQLLLPDGAELRARNPIAFVTAVCERFQCTVPFQSFSILHVGDKSQRRLPSLTQLKQDVYARIGGCCYVLNVFMRELLRALGFDTYFARCAIHGVEDCHMTVVVRGLCAQPDSVGMLLFLWCDYTIVVRACECASVRACERACVCEISDRECAHHGMYAHFNIFFTQTNLCGLWM